MPRYVTIKKFCELTGYTPTAVYKKKSDGTWCEGKVWRRAPDGRILVDLAGFELWVESGTGWFRSPLEAIRMSDKPASDNRSSARGRQDGLSNRNGAGACKLQPLVPLDECRRPREPEA